MREAGRLMDQDGWKSISEAVRCHSIRKRSFFLTCPKLSPKIKRTTHQPKSIAITDQFSGLLTKIAPNTVNFKLTVNNPPKRNLPFCFPTVRPRKKVKSKSNLRLSHFRHQILPHRVTTGRRREAKNQTIPPSFDTHTTAALEVASVSFMFV